VIDNSGSMAPYQAALAGLASDVLDPLIAAGVDFQVGVTTTGVDGNGGSSCPGNVGGAEAGRLFPVLGGNYPRILDASTPDLEEAFAANVAVGTCQAIERGLESATLATGALATLADDPATPEPNDGNLGLLRADANLAIVFLSDEVDQSPCAMPDCIADLEANKPGRITAHAIVGPATTGCGSAQAGDRYIHVATALGGSFFSICDPMATTVSNLASTLVSDAAYAVWSLGGTPADTDGNGQIDGADLSVTVDGAVVDRLDADGNANWAYDAARNAVIFTRDVSGLPAAGAVVEATWCG
jgi:hypothetical protein